jgi:type IV secretion system protein VirD4
MGASGSGKTQAFMFPLIKILGRAGESMIVTDPKGELYEACGNLLKEKGYKLILVNFRDPREGAAWNPFSYPYRIYKEGNADKANELLQDLASNILIDPNNKAEPFWEQTASNFFTGLSLGLFDDAPESEININSINMMAEVGEDRVGSSTYIKEYSKSKGELSPAYIAAASCINAPSDTRGGIMSTFRTKTRIFSSQAALSEMLSYSDFDIRDIGKEKTAVFLKVHDEKTTYHALATIFVKQVYEALIAVAQTCPKLKLPYRTNFVLDEFANMPALKDVETMITASRSRNIRFTFVIQNFSQLNKVYGKDVAETIKGNCGNFVYIMSTELAALEEVSKLLGDQKQEKAKKDEAQKPIRPLFTVSDLQALKEGEVIVNRFRSMPFKSKLTYDYKIDWGKKYEPMGYTERPRREVKVFDIKEFVNKLREKQGITDPSGMGMIPGMGMMPGMPMGSVPFANPYSNPTGPTPGGRRSSGVVPTSLEDYVRKIDEKIAELEREEAEENAKMEKEKNSAIEKNDDKVDDIIEKVEEHEDKVEKINESQEELKDDIEDILNHKTVERDEEPIIENVHVEEPIHIDEPTVEETHIEEPEADEYEKPEVHEIEDERVESDGYTQQPTYPKVSKPVVNVDVDSVVVNDKPETDEDFFDDFFGSEDE